MSTREYYEGVIADVLDELGAGDFDGRVRVQVMERLAERYGSIDDLATELDSYVVAEARRRVAPVFREVAGVNEEGHVAVPAHVDFQVWRGDYAEEVDEARFDAGRALDRLDLDLVAGIESGRADYDTDEVYFAAAAIGLAPEHDGPFSCYIDDADALDVYVAARRARESAGA